MLEGLDTCSGNLGVDVDVGLGCAFVDVCELKVLDFVAVGDGVGVAGGHGVDKPTGCKGSILPMWSCHAGVSPSINIIRPKYLKSKSVLVPARKQSCVPSYKHSSLRRLPRGPKGCQKRERNRSARDYG